MYQATQNVNSSQFHKYAHAVEPGSSEDEFFSSKRAKEKQKSVRQQRKLAHDFEETNAMRFSTRGQAVTTYDDGAADDYIMTESDGVGDEYTIEEVGDRIDEEDAIEFVLDYRISKISNDGNSTTV